MKMKGLGEGGVGHKVLFYRVKIENTLNETKIISQIWLYMQL